MSSATTQVQTSTPSYSNDVGLRELWLTIKAQKWIIVVCAVVTTLAGVAAALMLEPVYRAEVLVSPVKSGPSSGQLGELVSQLGGLGGLASGMLGRGGGGTDKEASIAVLGSRAFTGSFIQDKKLMPVLFPERWDAERRTWRDAGKRRPPSLNDAIRKFDKKIRTVSEDRRTGLVRVTIDWRDPAEAAAWANELIERLNATVRHQAIDDSKRSLEFLRHERAQTDVVALQQAITHLMEGQLESIMMANVRREFAFKVIDPAVASDLDDYVRPRKLLIVSGALFFGIMLGVFVAIVAAAISRPRPA